MRIKNMRIIIKFKQVAVQTIQIIVGTAIIAFSVSFFLLPNQLSSGGFTGVATILYYLFEFPVGITIFILNIPLFILSFIRYGKKFLFNAIIGTFLLSFFIDVFDKFNSLTSDRFLACIYGGIINGIGSALVLKSGSSTGGTDLLTQIIKSYKPDFRLSTMLIILDIIVVTINMLFFKKVEVGLYSTIVIFIMGKVIDIVFEGIDFAKMVLIISSEYQEISNKISIEIGRGITMLDGIGMYKKQNQKVLLCVANRNQISKIKKIVNDIDKKSFIIISNAREVFGNGFKE